MQSRDIFDPQTIRDVAHQIETVERLKALTLLTYADISAVNPAAMTPWRAEQLWQLYLMVYNELTRELETDRIEAVPAGSPERIAFLEGSPRATCAPTPRPRSMSTWRSKRRAASAAWRWRFAGWNPPGSSRWWRHDRPGLFASVAGTLSSFGMNILKAEAFANRRGLVLDTFTFADPLRDAGTEPHRSRPPARHRGARAQPARRT